MKLAPLLLRLLTACWLGAVMFASESLKAQTNEASGPTLTNIAQIRALGGRQPQESKRPVHIRGVVIYVNSQRSHFFLQDATAGVLVPVADTNLCPGFGLDVEVRGITGIYSGSQWGITEGKFTVHGPGILPQPVKATLADAQAVRHRSKWIEVEGIVLQVRKHKTPAIVLQLLDPSGVFPVAVTVPWESFSATNLMGARVRIRGLNVRAEIAPLLVPEAKQVSIITPGFADPFTAPGVSVSGLRASGPKLERVTVRGTVLRTLYKPSPQNGVYIRDDTGALQVTFLAPPPAYDPGYVPGESPIPEVHPGDLVEVVGSPTAIKPNVFLQHSQMRVLHTGPEPDPIIATPADIAADKFTSELVTVRGRLLGRHEIATGRNFWRDVLRLSADGREVDVFVESNVSGRFALLSLNDLIEARGIAVPDDGAALGSSPKEFSVQVASIADVHSLGVAPEVARTRTLQLAGGAGTLVLLAGSWIALLRSRLKRQRRIAIERERSEAAIREANASLERRVSERTAEVEKARQETARALDTERELNAMKTRFVSIVSHEFRTPLGIIMSAVELLRNYQDRLPATKRDELHADIYGSTRQMAGLMEQVLVLGRVEGGKLAFKPAPVDVATLCQKIADEVSSATARRCQIITRCDGSLEGAQGDEALIRHIFSNLLSNGVKYSPAGAAVEFTVRREGEHAVFTVSDRGIGIPEADLPKLFEAFRRASNVGEIPGTGLGMLIVKRCVELQYGRIEIQSKVGEGTTVTVTLPVFTTCAVMT